jgi:plasmid maintenance system antidote protein VapI
MWQDFGFAFIGFLFTVMLIPQLIDGLKGKAVMNFWTCYITGIGCIAMGDIDLTLNLPIAAMVSMSTGLMWIMLMYCSEMNKRALSYIPPQMARLSPPGDTIQDLMNEWGLTIEEFSRRMGYQQSHMMLLIAGNAPLTKDIAEDLSRVLGSTKEFWLKREKTYREEMQGR